MQWASSELAFRRLLRRASELPDLVEGSLRRKRTFWRYADRPGWTYHHLTVRAGIDLGSALVLLGDARRAYSAEVLMRSELEYIATVAWIHRGMGSRADDGANVLQCRSIRYELQMLREIRRSLVGRLSASPAISDAYRKSQVRAIDKNIASLQSAGGAAHCHHKLAPPPDVSTLLRQLQELDAFKGALALWVAASGVSHHQLPYRIHAKVAKGTSVLGAPTTLGFRVHILDGLLMAYGNGATWVLEDLNADVGALAGELAYLALRTARFREDLAE